MVLMAVGCNKKKKRKLVGIQRYASSASVVLFGVITSTSDHNEDYDD